MQAAEMPQLPPRVVVSVEYRWFRNPPEGFASVAVEICSDSLVAVNVINGDWAPYSAHILRLAKEIQVLLHAWWKVGYVRPRTAGASWCRHIFREENKKADEFATKGVRGICCASAREPPTGVKALRAFCDGGKRDGICGSGYCVYAVDEWAKIDKGRWYNVLDVSFSVGPQSVTVAETLAILESIKSIQHLIVRRNVFFNSQARVKPLSLLV